jgi:predicted membrane protein
MALPEHASTDGRGGSSKDDAGIRILSVLTGLVVAGLLIFAPHASQDRWGAADPFAAFLLLWSMGAGFASGLGLAGGLPRVAQAFLSSPACLGALVLAVLQIAGH